MLRVSGWFRSRRLGKLMLRTSRIPLLIGAIVQLASCTEAEVPPSAEVAQPAASRFAAESIHPGDTIAGLVVRAAEIAPASFDAVYVGWVQFAGEIVIGGEPRFIEGNDPDSLCFLVDEETSGRLPRMRHDDRRVWFCFTNQLEAKEALADRIGEQVRVRISDYRTVYQFTDAFDTARFETLSTPGAN